MAPALCLFGCGYPGEPLPPLLNIPQRVTDLAAVERGSKIIVQFTVPKLTTESVVIKGPLHFDLRAGERGPAPFDTNAWRGQHSAVIIVRPAGVRTLGDANYQVSYMLPNYGLLPVAKGKLGADGRIALPEGNSNDHATSGIINIWRLP